MIKFQLRKILYQKETGAAFLIMLVICLLSYVLNCVEFFGEYSSNLIASNQLHIIGDSSNLAFILRLIIPLAAALPGSGIYYYEKKNNLLPVAFSRSGSHEKYYFSHLFAVFAVSFAVVFVPLILNVLLSDLTFPSESVRNIGGHPSSDDPYYLMRCAKNILLNSVRINYPQLYSLIFISAMSVFSGFIGIFTYNVSFLFKKNNYLSFAVFFVCSNIVEAVSAVIYEYGFSIAYFDYLFADTHTKKNMTAFFGMILLLTAVIAAVAPAAIKKLKKGL